MDIDVDAVFVLSVRSFTERIQHIERHFAEQGVNFEFIFDYDPQELTADCVDEYFGESDMGSAHKSLVMKHIQAWHLGLERGCGKILVFEDDAILVNNFAHQFHGIKADLAKLDAGYLVFLGGSDTKVPDDFFLQKGPLIRLPIATAEGYLCDAESMRRRISWLKAHKVRLPADHLIRHIDEACGTPQYWLDSPLVQQGSVFGMFDTYLDDHRKKHSRYYNYLRYRWNQFGRRQLRKWIVKLKYLVQVK